MKQKLIAIFCMVLIVLMPCVIALETSTLGEVVESVTPSTVLNDVSEDFEEAETGETIIVNVGSYEPLIVKANLIQDNDIDVYAYLTSGTIGSILNVPSSVEPFYSGIEILKMVVLPADAGSADMIKSGPKFRAPRDYTMDNMGTVWFKIEQIPVEADIPDSFNLNFTSIVYFEEAQRLFQLAQQDLSLPEVSDEDTWYSEYLEDSWFFGYRGAIRASNIGEDSATFTIYSSDDYIFPFVDYPQQIAQVTLNVGEESLRYFNLQDDTTELVEDSFKLKLNEITDPQKEEASVEIEIDGTIYRKEISEGMTLYPGSIWSVDSISIIDPVTSGGDTEYKIVLKSSKGKKTISTYAIGEEEDGKDIILSKAVSDTKLNSFFITTIDDNFNKLMFEKNDEIVSIKFDVSDLIDVDEQETLLGDYIDETKAEEFIDKIEDKGTQYLPIIENVVNALKSGYDVTKFENLLGAVTDGDIAQVIETFSSATEVTYQTGSTGWTRSYEIQQDDSLAKVMLEILPAGYQYELTEDGDQVTIRIFKSYSGDPCDSIGYVVVPDSGLSEDDVEGVSQEKLLCTARQQFEEIMTVYTTQVDNNGYLYSDLAAIQIASVYKKLDELGFEGAKEFELSYIERALAHDNVPSFGSLQEEMIQLQNAITQKLKYGTATLEDNSKTISVKLLNVRETPSYLLPVATITVEGITYEFNEGVALPFTKTESEDGNEYTYQWIVQDIQESYVTFQKDYVGMQPVDATLSTATVTLKDTEEIDGHSITIKETELFKRAHVTIIPGTGRELISRSNFSLHIMVEKSPVNLTPQNIDTKINNTQIKIEKLQNTIDTLEKLVKTWKTVCLATFGFLTVKNSFLSGFSTSQARSFVMRGSDGQSGWYAYCQANSGKNKLHETFDDCITMHSSEISQQIEDTKKAINEVNDQFDDESYQHEDWYKELTTGYEDIDQCTKYLGTEEFFDLDSLRDYSYWLEISDSESYNELDGSNGYNLKTEADNYVQSYSLSNLEKQQACNTAVEAIKSEEWESYWKENEEEHDRIFINLYNQALEEPELDSEEFKYIDSDTVDVLNAVYKKENDNNIYADTLAGVLVLAPLDVAEYEDYLNEKLKTASGIDKEEIEKDLERLTAKYRNDKSAVIATNLGEIYIDRSNDQLYVAKITQFSSFTTRDDYATLPNIERYSDGSPYCVPTGNGEFAKILDFYKDGSPSTLELWNVGADGRLCTSDDVLIMHESQLELEPSTYNRLRSTVERMVDKFEDKADGELVSVEGTTFVISSGKANSLDVGASLTCYDVMNPQDCKLMFNVCDPVMCPASRFNLGGRWNVDNVIETGLIGSIVLPWGSGDIVPVCLTGVLSGLQNIQSFMEGYVECLQAAKYDGTSVGICDKIRSVFVCEMIARELINIFNANGGILELLSEKVFGEQQGGGEYLTFQSSFENVANSVEYFTQDYAQTAFGAFEGRSTEEIGALICKQAIFGKMPEFGDLFTQLTEPESPPQFTAMLTRSPYSATQHQEAYQVYYHIYAGEDADATYSVYLRSSNGDLWPHYVTEACGKYSSKVDAGSMADYTVDCVATEGYDEVCVRINGEEHCGFGSVSSAFSLDYLNDLLVQDELSREINSEEDCVPSAPRTSPSLASVVTPYEMDMLTTGIVRVCAVNNPGAGTNPNDWLYVGTCGETSDGQSLGSCWLDSRTVTIQDTENYESVMNELEQIGFEETKDNYGIKDLLDEATSEDTYDDLVDSVLPIESKSCNALVGSINAFNDLYQRTLSVDVSVKTKMKIGEVFLVMGKEIICASGLQTSALDEEEEQEVEQEEESDMPIVVTTEEEGTTIGVTTLPSCSNCDNGECLTASDGSEYCFKPCDEINLCGDDQVCISGYCYDYTQVEEEATAQSQIPRCSTGETCADDSECLAGFCLISCSDTQPCPSGTDYVCVADYCQTFELTQTDAYCKVESDCDVYELNGLEYECKYNLCQPIDLINCEKNIDCGEGYQCLFSGDQGYCYVEGALDLTTRIVEDDSVGETSEYVYETCNDANVKGSDAASIFDDCHVLGLWSTYGIIRTDDGTPDGNACFLGDDAEGNPECKSCKGDKKLWGLFYTQGISSCEDYSILHYTYSGFDNYGVPFEKKECEIDNCDVGPCTWVEDDSLNSGGKCMLSKECTDCEDCLDGSQAAYDECHSGQYGDCAFSSALIPGTESSCISCDNLASCSSYTSIAPDGKYEGEHFAKVECQNDPCGFGDCVWQEDEDAEFGGTCVEQTELRCSDCGEDCLTGDEEAYDFCHGYSDCFLGSAGDSSYCLSCSYIDTCSDYSLYAYDGYYFDEYSFEYLECQNDPCGLGNCVWDESLGICQKEVVEGLEEVTCTTGCVGCESGDSNAYNTCLALGDCFLGKDEFGTPTCLDCSDYIIDSCTSYNTYILDAAYGSSTMLAQACSNDICNVGDCDLTVWNGGFYCE